MTAMQEFRDALAAMVRGEKVEFPWGRSATAVLELDERVRKLEAERKYARFKHGGKWHYFKSSVIAVREAGGPYLPHIVMLENNMGFETCDMTLAEIEAADRDRRTLAEWQAADKEQG